jgi:hypothetical protein
VLAASLQAGVTLPIDRHAQIGEPQVHRSGVGTLALKKIEATNWQRVSERSDGQVDVDCLIEIRQSQSAAVPSATRAGAHEIDGGVDANHTRTSRFHLPVLRQNLVRPPSG